MKADIEAREERKAAAAIVSAKANAEGNAFFKSGNYIQARESYSRAIECTRADKSFYTNRALSSLHLFDPLSALKDCNTAIDIYECFEKGRGRFEKDYANTGIVHKAFLRRAKAQILLNLFSEARASLAAATTLLQSIHARSASIGNDPLKKKALENHMKQIGKMQGEMEEKEKFAREELQEKERADRAEKEADQAAVSGSYTAAAAPSSAASAKEDQAQLASLLASISSAHGALLSSSSSTPVPSSSPSPPASWSLSLPAVQFLLALLEASEGNKEHVLTQVEARSV